MTTITLKTPEVQVTLPDGLSEEQLSGFKPFTSWIQTLSRSLSLQHSNPQHPFHQDPYALRSITIQSYDLFGGSRLGFLKLQADVRNRADESLPGAVFLRGPSVAMLIMLIPDDADDDDDAAASAPGPEREQERHVILTVQPRVPAGSLAFVELPAGMVDGGTFAGAAAREIEEELGLRIPGSELTCLSELAAPTTTQGPEQQQQKKKSDDDESEGLPFAMFPSAGGCDEHVPIYMHERRVPREQLGEWTGKLTGLRDHGEKITLKLVRMQDLWRQGARDAKCLAALALWEGLRREGKV
ncbi:hypothetical protein F5Y15DRAFT_418207 [Xylariaceae sp. FL0016]|nr:hypothetical protein F5Y15DRAFT_418207 [Xylariaceae sp. FL0016]